MAVLTPRATAALVVLAALTLGVPSQTAAADDPSEPPGTVTTSPPPEVDANSPGLKLAQGATLAPAKVLDIKSVVEDLGGEERREDTNENVTFALQAEVLFPRDSAKLNPQARSRIQAIAEEIKKQSAGTVRVFGFTDNLGSYAHGLTLSKKRAEAVHDLLAADLGGNITFEVRGYSEDYPIADNSSEEGRKKNRRVEVSFPRTTADPESTSDTASDTGGDES
ncbi:OmpA family protein [Streptomyces caniscabiei]|uniref:OmpA family protein n=1 Tax=Streptomyces caniscabiei TaxID=2746961 RepID=A0ABU4MJG5_9ACTN|nr:OmpA family protein [Streptomyces caniscabiei]MBE4738951.1 OmpA family protein [Streptomyces caniscabiei]MBE4757909.1 OmpA family protein [Streptomyces caniscabiei]MBE4772238.1 OmpA family protein [Streptomyces caniscabiei]MBE4787570.1 OmpA family protein [Streptomyces caniscabiei]MBE4794285.1 OmpA family protein [Streptomyces caniscabiei]